MSQTNPPNGPQSGSQSGLQPGPQAPARPVHPESERDNRSPQEILRDIEARRQRVASRFNLQSGSQPPAAATAEATVVAAVASTANNAQRAVETELQAARNTSAAAARTARFATELPRTAEPPGTAIPTGPHHSAGRVSDPDAVSDDTSNAAAAAGSASLEYPGPADSDIQACIERVRRAIDRAADSAAAGASQALDERERQRRAVRASAQVRREMERLERLVAQRHASQDRSGARGLASAGASMAAGSDASGAASRPAALVSQDPAFPRSQTMKFVVRHPGVAALVGIPAAVLLARRVNWRTVGRAAARGASRMDTAQLVSLAGLVVGAVNRQRQGGAPSRGPDGHRG